MFLMSNNCKDSDSHSKPQVWSMTGKLTLYLTLSFFGLFIISSLILYLNLVVNLEREQNNFIDDEFVGLQSFLSVYHEDPRFLWDEILLERKEKKNPKYLVRVQDRQGNLLVESPRMEEDFPHKSFPLPSELSAAHTTGVKWKDNRGKSFVLKTVLIEDGSQEKRRYIVQIDRKSTRLNS